MEKKIPREDFVKIGRLLLRYFGHHFDGEILANLWEASNKDVNKFMAAIKLVGQKRELEILNEIRKNIV